MKRMIDTDIWADARVDELGTMAKLLWIYILTSPQGNLAGCFELTMRRIEVDTGVKAAQARKCLDELSAAGLISCSADTGEVLIVRWRKYNWSGGSSKLEKPLATAIKSVKDVRFREFLANEYFETFGKELEIDKEPNQNISSDTLSDKSDRSLYLSISNPVTGKGEGVQGEGESRHPHGEFANVMLTDKELELLKARFPDDWERRIDDLSYYIGSKGVKYKSHYRTILNWDRKNAPKGVSADAKYGKYR